MNKAEQPLSLPAFVAASLVAYIAAGNWMIAWMLRCEYRVKNESRRLTGF